MNLGSWARGTLMRLIHTHGQTLSRGAAGRHGPGHVGLGAMQPCGHGPLGHMGLIIDYNTRYITLHTLIM